MILSLHFRERLSGFLQVVQDELDNIVATLKSWSNVEHLDNGTHSPNVGNLLQFLAGTNIGAGQVVYVSAGADQSAPGRAFLGDASSVSKSTQAAIVGLATESISAGANVTTRDRGIFSGLTGLQAGKVYYLATTPGALTFTAPANAVLIGLATSTTDLLLLLRNPTTISQQAVLTWDGTTTGTQDMASGGILPFTTVGTYTITVATTMTVLVKASAGGGGGGSSDNNAGGNGAGGGGGGASHTAGLSVSLVPGKTYTAVVGAGGAAGVAGGVTSFKNTTDTITHLDLAGGGAGQPNITAGAGGAVTTGAGGVAGGAGGAGGSTATGSGGSNAVNGAAGAGGGGGGNPGSGGNGGNGVASGGGGGAPANPGSNNGGVAGGGGTGSVGGGGGGGGGAQFTSVTGSFGGGGGGGAWSAGVGGAGMQGALALVFVSAP